MLLYTEGSVALRGTPFLFKAAKNTGFQHINDAKINQTSLPLLGFCNEFLIGSKYVGEAFCAVGLTDSANMLVGVFLFKEALSLIFHVCQVK
jgi:hypothetical protein